MSVTAAAFRVFEPNETEVITGRIGGFYQTGSAKDRFNKLK